MNNIENGKQTSSAKATAVAIFGGGCFWCTEAVFKMMRGVTSVLPGYAGGTTENPTYAEVSEGNTGHAEVVRIEYDPEEVKYESLLTVFFGSHDPTTLNQQGADIGTQYRSVIFYTTDEQKAAAEKFIKDINESDVAPSSAQPASPQLQRGEGYGEAKPVVTEVVPLDKFYEAENYHKDYFANHPDAGYCQVVINPKLEKVQKQFADLLKTIDK